jgi:hypothetical protein
MKKLIVLIAAIFCLGNAVAQSPAYPSKEQVLKDAKSALALNYIGQVFKSPLTWDKIKLQYKEYVNGGELVDSRFYDYRSDLAYLANLDYKDMTEVNVLATTPKDAEGKYYDFLITVRYTRYGGIIGLTSWKFKETYHPFTSYYQRGGNASADAKRVESAEKILMNYKGEKNTPEKPIKFYFPFYNFDIVKIDSIFVDKNKQDENLTYQRYWYFKMKVNIVKRDGNIFTYYQNAELPFSIEYRKEGDAKDWAPATVSIEMYERHFPNVKPITSTEAGLSGKNLYRELTSFGFEEVYKKQTMYERTLYRLSDLQDFGKEMEAMVKLVYDNPTEGRKKLETMVNPEATNKNEIIDSYYNAIVDAKKYLVNLGNVYINDYSGHSDDENSVTGKKITSKMSLNVNFKREGTDDKAKLKAYKEAGISKETLKTTWGGRYDDRWFVDLEIVFKNNNWYINNAAKAPEKFN